MNKTLVQLPKGPPPDFTYDPPSQPFPRYCPIKTTRFYSSTSPADCSAYRASSQFTKTVLKRGAQRDFPTAKPVHRLDMDTSGLLLMGLGDAAHRYLSIGFERRLVEKSYIALVFGHMEEKEGACRSAADLRTGPTGPVR